MYSKIIGKPIGKWKHDRNIMGKPMKNDKAIGKPFKK